MKQLPICRTKEEIVMFKNLKKMDKKAICEELDKCLAK